MNPYKQHILNVFGREPETLDELAHCVIKVIESATTDNWGPSTEKCNVVGFAWHIYKGMVSNSHSAPMDGVTNWGTKPGIPSAYPGWNGRVWIRYHNSLGSRTGSGPFSRTLTYPGTGGGGSYDGPWTSVKSARWKQYRNEKSGKMYPEIDCYSWDYRIFQSDWPGLQAAFEQERIIDALMGTKTKTHHNFLWEDPATKAADAAFIEECAISEETA